MNKKIIKKDNRNFIFYKKNIENIDYKDILKGLDEYSVFICSENFGDYDLKSLENMFEYFVNTGIISIHFLGKGAKKLEENIDNIIVNKYLEEDNELFLNILTLSQDNKKNRDGFFYTFLYGGTSIKNKDEYVKENYIFVDSEELYNLLLSFIN